VAAIVRSDLSRSATAGWILTVVLLPLVGTLAYFLMRKPTEEEIRQAQEAAADHRGSWPDGVHRRLPGE
jgi:Phospholipase_D-nuclease N-terminal